MGAAEGMVLTEREEGRPEERSKPSLIKNYREKLNSGKGKFCIIDYFKSRAI